MQRDARGSPVRRLTDFDEPAIQGEPQTPKSFLVGGYGGNGEVAELIRIGGEVVEFDRLAGETVEGAAGEGKPEGG